MRRERALHLSIRVVGAYVELGTYDETTDGQRFSVPYEHRYYDGLLDLYTRDAFTLFREGKVTLSHFAQPNGDYASLLRDEETISVRRRDLLVREKERRRFEAEVLPTLRLDSSDGRDFTDFLHNGRRYRFTPTQARVLQFLFDAAVAGAPWQSGKAVLAASGSRSVKLSDLFKRRLEWRELIEADGRGSYRLISGLIQRRAA